MEDICDGVKILCERMGTNPEDFDYDGRFYDYGQEILSAIEADPDTLARRMRFFTQAERDMLTTAYSNMVRATYTRRVIETLVAEPQPKRKGPISNSWLAKDAMDGLNLAFDKAYAENHETDSYVYKAKDRYQLDLPWK